LELRWQHGCDPFPDGGPHLQVGGCVDSGHDRAGGERGGRVLPGAFTSLVDTAVLGAVLSSSVEDGDDVVVFADDQECSDGGPPGLTSDGLA
jgi:hypothetical protein